MMIVLTESATPEQVAEVVALVEGTGAQAHVSTGETLTLVGAIGDSEHDGRVAGLGLEQLEFVDRVVPIAKQYKLSSRQIKGGEDSILDISGTLIGQNHFSLIAGPCTVESRDQLLSSARAVRDGGASMLRGGAYKPRTSPYSFQGLGQEGLDLLAEAKAETGLPIVTELMDARDLEPVLEVADRRPQHAELPSSYGNRQVRPPRDHQARPFRHSRGAADGGRICAQGGE